MKNAFLSLACVVSISAFTFGDQDTGNDVNGNEQSYIFVAFDENGGFCEPSFLYYNLDGVYDVFPLAYRTGYSLVGWMGFQATEQKTLTGYTTTTTTTGGATKQEVTPCYATTVSYTPQGWMNEGDPVNPLANAAKAIWLPNTYTICFKPNGGRGTMQDQEFSYGEEKALRSCSFVRYGCEFVGWSRVGGEALYADCAVVSNLTSEADDVVTLFAQWKVRDNTPTPIRSDFEPTADFDGSVKHTLNGLVFDSDGEMCGMAQITTAKATAKGVRVGGFVMLADGKKQTIKSATGTVSGGCLTAKTGVGKLGSMEITVGGNGFKGTLGDMTLASADVDEDTGILSGTLKMSYFDAKTGKVKTKSIAIGGVTSGGEAVGTATVKGKGGTSKSFAAEIE